MTRRGAGWASGTEVLLYLMAFDSAARIQGAAWGLGQGLVVEGGVARARSLPDSMEDLSLPGVADRVRAEQARKAVGAQEPLVVR